jgi:zinc protease
MNDDGAPLIHIKIAFKNAGSSYQEKTKTGVPVFYSDAVFCGSGKYSKTQFSEACSNISAKIYCNADMDNIYFSLTAPKITLNDAISLFNTAITSPNFEEDKVKIIQNGLGYSAYNYSLDPVGVAFSSIIPSIIFKSHPYENGVVGFPEDFMKLSIEDLKSYKSKFLTARNAEICVFGDVSENRAKSLVDKAFSGVERGTPSADDVKDVTPTLNAELKKYYVDGPQSSIFFVLKMEKPPSPKRYIAAVLYRVLGEGYVFRGKILSELRTKKGLIYSGSLCYVDLNHASYVFGKVQTDNSKAQSAIDSLKEIIKNLRENGINQSELQFAKSNIKGKMLVGLRNAENLCHFYFLKKLRGFGKDVLSEIMEKTDAVTLQEVNSLAKEILDEKRMSFVVIGGGSI